MTGVMAASVASGQGAGLNPPPVIRGESPSESAAHVDWLNVTFPKPAISQEGLLALLGRIFGRPISATPGRGMLGFESGLTLHAHHGHESSPIGCLAFGGESQRGRWLFQLTGQGCSFVVDWPNLRDLLESLEAKITRCDLAVDFLEGEYTVDDAVSIYEMDGFTSSGRKPSSHVAGDWIGEGLDGRTLYIGKATNGKMLRVYEKGRQLGDPDSDWVRFEVQLGNRDRVIPFDVLTEPDGFFAGAYPALAELVAEAARRIPTQQTEGLVTLAHLVTHLKRCYGKVIHTATEHAGATYAELIEAITVIATPRRLNHTSFAAGVDWADVHAQVKKGT